MPAEAPAPKVPAPKAPAPTTTGGTVTAKAAGWKASDATSSYALTAAERAALDAQTADERAADRKELKAKAKRLKQLRKVAKDGKPTLSDTDTKELADLEALDTRVKATAKLAFQKQDTEEVLAAAELTVNGWYSNIVTGSFLGIPLTVHRELADRLDKAQGALVGDATINPEDSRPPTSARRSGCTSPSRTCASRRRRPGARS